MRTQHQVPAADSSLAGGPLMRHRDSAVAQEDRNHTPRGRDQSEAQSGKQTFRDRDWAPLMKVAPAGRFLMGSPESEPGRGLSEGPVHEVIFKKPFAIGVYPVTCREFARFAGAEANSVRGALKWTGFEMEQLTDAHWGDPGFHQSDNHPVTCISWDDATNYANWLSRETGHAYRLPTEAEWEYAARAETNTAYWWGQSMSGEHAHYDRSYDATGEGAIGQCTVGTIAVDALPANPWGLHQLLGNAWEWCQDTWHENYAGSPVDGSAWVAGRQDRRIVRGGSWSGDPDVVRCAQRRWISTHNRMVNVGLRLAPSFED